VRVGSSLRGAAEWVRLSGLEPLLIVLAIGLFVWGLSIADLGSDRRPPTTVLGATAPAPWVGVEPDPSDQLSSPSDPTEPIGPWLLRRRGAALEVSAADGLDGGRYRTAYRALVQVGADPQAFDVDRWGDANAPALFSVRKAAGSLDVRVFGLDTAPGVVAQGTAETPPARSGQRRFLVGTWSGRKPDLFVVDGGTGAVGSTGFRPWKLRIYSGESGFSNLLLLVNLPDRVGPSLDPWWLDLRRLAGGRPDLVLISRDVPTGSERTEIHILTGASQYQQFSIEAPTPIPAEPGPLQRILYQRSSGMGALLNIDLAGDPVTVQELPIGG
jgi:hypothetical protein